MVGQKISVKIFVIILLIIGAIWTGFPIIWMLSNSFKGKTEIFTFLSTWISPNFSFEAYAKIFSNP